MTMWNHTEEVFLHRSIPNVPADGSLDPTNLDNTVPVTDTWKIASSGKNIWAHWSGFGWKCVRVEGTADTASAVSLAEGETKYLYIKCLSGSTAGTLDDSTDPVFEEISEAVGDANGLIYTSGSYVYFRVAKGTWGLGEDAPSIQLYHHNDIVWTGFEVPFTIVQTDTNKIKITPGSVMALYATTGTAPVVPTLGGTALDAATPPQASVTLSTTTHVYIKAVLTPGPVGATVKYQYLATDPMTVFLATSYQSDSGDSYTDTGGGGEAYLLLGSVTCDGSGITSISQVWTSGHAAYTWTNFGHFWGRQ